MSLIDMDPGLRRGDGGELIQNFLLMRQHACVNASEDLGAPEKVPFSSFGKNRNPRSQATWIPAFAGMTSETEALSFSQKTFVSFA